MHATKTEGMIFCGMNEAYTPAKNYTATESSINGGELDCEKVKRTSDRENNRL